MWPPGQTEHSHIVLVSIRVVTLTPGISELRGQNEVVGKNASTTRKAGVGLLRYVTIHTARAIVVQTSLALAGPGDAQRSVFVTICPFHVRIILVWLSSVLVSCFVTLFFFRLNPHHVRPNVVRSI